MSDSPVHDDVERTVTGPSTARLRIVAATLPLALVAIGVLFGEARSADPEAGGKGTAPAVEESEPGIIIGDEEVTAVEGDETAPRSYEADLIELPEIPELPDLPERLEVEIIEREDGGVRISIGDEVTEAMGDREHWETTDEPDRVSFGHDVFVGPDEIVEGDILSVGGDVIVAGAVDGDVVALAGDIIVEGEVLGDVVTLWGNIDLDRSAVCGEDVVAIGGAVDQNGGHVDGQVLSLGFLPGTGGLSAPGFEKALILCGVASFILFGIFAAILAFIFRSNTERMLGEIRERPVHTFWVGAGMHAIWPLVFLVLVVTIFLLPLAVLGIVLWWIVAQSGIVLGAVRLGQAVLRRPSAHEVLPGALLGGLLVHVPFMLGLLAYTGGSPPVQAAGITLVTLAAGLSGILMLIGSGALVATRFGEAGGGINDGGAGEPLFDAGGGVPARFHPND